MPRRLPEWLRLPVLESFAGPVEGLVALGRWFVRVRWVSVVSLPLIVLGTRWALGIRLPLLPLLVSGAMLGAYNVAFYWHARRLSARPAGTVTHREAERFAHAQLVADLVFVTLLLHYSGGVENPMSIFYLFHIILAGVMLPKGQSYAAAFLAFGLFAALVLLEYAHALEHHHLPMFISEAQYRSWRFIFGHLTVLLVTLLLSAFFAGSLAQRLREQRAELAATSSRLAALERRKSRFMRVAAHQLRAPLAAIRSMLSVVLGNFQGVDEAKRQEMLRRVEVRTDLMLELLSDLLALSRLRDARGEEARPELVVVNDVLTQVVELFGPRTEEKRQTLRVELAADRAAVMADPDRLVDAFTNLLSNAVKYTREGGSVTVASRADRSTVVCEVADTGIGVAPEDQTRLFEEFFRAGNARDFAEEGTGLGLSIVREIVESAGGSIVCESERNVGTRFTVTLPFAACTLPRRQAEARSSPA